MYNIFIPISDGTIYFFENQRIAISPFQCARYVHVNYSYILHRLLSLYYVISMAFQHEWAFDIIEAKLSKSWKTGAENFQG